MLRQVARSISCGYTLPGLARSDSRPMEFALQRAIACSFTTGTRPRGRTSGFAGPAGFYVSSHHCRNLRYRLSSLSTSLQMAVPWRQLAMIPCVSGSSGRCEQEKDATEGNQFHLPARHEELQGGWYDA